MSHSLKVYETALRSELERLLADCTAEQVTQFGRFFPKDREKLTMKELPFAVDLCHRTVIKNAQKMQVNA